MGFIYLDGLSVSEAFYLTVVTISTMSYGDLHPLTLEGRLFAVFVIMAGVGSFLGLVATVTEFYLSRKERKARMGKLNMLVGVFFSELG
ncbi:MAG: potassium channel family protein [Candidatus Altiarchaeota archaeon]|nr:potassium channel family protein [Candidatus Altiarchaeota archaeon]